MKLAASLAVALSPFLSPAVAAPVALQAPSFRPGQQAQRRVALPHQQIGNGLAGFGGVLDPGDYFGSSVAALGDFDHNGVPDLVVTAYGDDDGGAVWLLFLDRKGRVIGERKISDTAGGFTGGLVANGSFFYSVDSIGDLDGDGVTELIVGSPHDFGQPPGCVWVLFLKPNGTVKSHVRIDAPSGAFPDAEPLFGFSVAALGDFDHDGVPDVAVSSYFETWILFLNANGTVRAQQHLAIPSLALEALGDFDGDGVEDLAASYTEGLFEGDIGHLLVVLLNADGSVKATTDTGTTDLGFWPLPNTCSIYYSDNGFGQGIASLGDRNGDGVTDLAVGAPWRECCDDAGGAWILRLNPSGGVQQQYEITQGSWPYDLPLHPLEGFGHSVASPGDIDGDGRPELAVGAPWSMGTYNCSSGSVGAPRGAVRLLFGVP